jgi:hypothetical protein
MLLLTPYCPALPGHTASDRDCRESAALRRRMVEGAWMVDASMRQAQYFADEVRELLPDPVLSRNAALQIWGQIATLYDDSPTVEATGAPDLGAILTPDLWPMRQQAHLLQVAANECLMRVDIDADAQITYRVVPADTVVLRSAQRKPAGAAPFNPIRGQPVRVEECRLRVSPDGTGEVWTWEIWDISNPAAPTFQILAATAEKDAKGQDVQGWADMTEYYSGAPGWPDGYVDTEGRPVLPYVICHRRVGDHLREPFAGQEAVTGTLDASALWTFWFAGVRDGTHPQRYLIDGVVPSTAVSSAGTSGVMGVQTVVMNPQTVIQIHGMKRGDAYSSPSAGQWQPACDPASLGAAIESYEAGLAVGAGLSPADIQRGSSNASGYSIVVSRKGQRDQQKKLIPPCRMADQILMAKAAALLHRADLPTDPAAWSIQYATLTTSPEEAKADQEVIKGDLELGLLSRRGAIRRRNPGITDTQIDALIMEIDGEKEEPEMDAEEAADEDADLRAALDEARAALASGDAAAAAAAMTRAAGLLEADAGEDAEEEMDAEEMPPGSDNAS